LIDIIPVITHGSDVLMMHQGIYGAIGKDETVRDGPGKLRQEISTLLGNTLSGRSKVSYADVGRPHVPGQGLQLASEICFAPVPHSRFVSVSIARPDSTVSAIIKPDSQI